MKLKTINRRSVFPDCADAANNLIIVGAHEIYKADHDAMVFNFFDSETVDPMVLEIPNANVDENRDCKIYGVKVKFNPSNRDDNTDLEVSTARIASLSAPHTYHMIFYSLHLYKGLAHGLNLDRLEFRKGSYVEDGQEAFTILVTGIDNTGRAVYYGDLTNMYP